MWLFALYRQRSWLSIDSFLGSPPTFIKSLKSKTIREGKGLSLTCSVTGKPKPRIKWKKDGRTILTDDRITIRNMHKLRIKNAGPQDSGIYHCFAKNRHGQSNSEKAKVTVLRCVDNVKKAQQFQFCMQFGIWFLACPLTCIKAINLAHDSVCSLTCNLVWPMTRIKSWIIWSNHSLGLVFYSSITIQSKKQALVLIGKEEMVWTVERSLEG